MRSILVLSATLFLVATPSHAADFFVDPENGKADNNGSEEKPWRNLQEVFDAGLVESRQWESLPYKPGKRLVPKNPGAAIKAGDTIWLRNGYHGSLSIEAYYNRGVITLAAAKGHEPRFRGVRIRSSSHWRLVGLHVSLEFGEGKKPRTLVKLEAHNWRGPIHDVTVEACTLRSAKDTSAWSADDWNSRSSNGIDADGTRMTIRGNRLKNVNFGISVGASHSLVERNLVENFAGDGLRGLGDHTVFQYNTVKNCHDVNANHDDGFQSWSTGTKGVGKGQVVGIVLRGNTIIGNEDPNQPHRGMLQGIGCFDGMFVDWIVENNVVIVDHWHGITLLGARGCRIVNNTVIDPNQTRPGPAGVRVGKHKNGTPSSGCTVRNNLTTSLSVGEGRDMVTDHNLLVEDPDLFFLNPADRDLRLKKGSPAIDAGARELAPPLDINGVTRPQGPAVDVGAYEFKAAPR